VRNWIRNWRVFGVILLRMKHTALALLAASLLCSTRALAQDEPDIVVEADHRVSGAVMVRVPVDQARAMLADPVRVAEIEGGTARIRVLSEDSCKNLHTAIAHPVASVEYTSRSCPTANGFHTKLVQSDTLEDFEAEWTVEEVEGGTLLRYVVRTIPRIAVPQFIVDRQSKGSVKQLLQRVKVHLEAPLR